MMTHLNQRVAAGLCGLCLLSGCFRVGYELLDLEEPLSTDSTGVPHGVPDSVPPGSGLDAGVLLWQPTPADSGTTVVVPDADAPPPTDCEWGTPALLVISAPGSAQLFGGPHLSPDALTLYFALQLSGSSEDIYVATRSSRNDGFGSVVPISEVNSATADGSPFVTADGRSLYFFSQRDGSAPTDRDLYVASRSTAAGTFGTPSALSTVNSSQLDQAPHLSADGLELWLGSHRGNTGFEDLYVARRARTSDAFGTPVAANELNSAGRDTGAALSADGLSLYYSSERTGTEGGFDLWQARRESRTLPFTSIEPLDVLNGRNDEFDPTLSGDEQELIFVSNRGGSTRLWRTTRVCE